MRWKTVGVYAGIAACVILLFGTGVQRSGAETATWTNPSTYTDNTTIPPAKQAQLSTEIQYRIGAGAFTTFGTATGGASTFAAPYVTPGGGISYWRVRSISVADNNATGSWSGEYTFNRPFQVPGTGQVLDVR